MFTTTAGRLPSSHDAKRKRLLDVASGSGGYRIGSLRRDGMICAAKALGKPYWPGLRLRMILLPTFVFVAALPGVGAQFLRVYENVPVRQTETELVAQGAALAAAASAAWPGAQPAP